MYKLAVTAPELLRDALKDAGLHSPQSRFLHRLHCLMLVALGSSCCEVARLFGDDPRSVERWVHRFQRRGVVGLKDESRPGRHTRLGEADIRELELALAASPRELGYAQAAWSARLLRAEIRRRFAVDFSQRHCQRILQRTRQRIPPPQALAPTCSEPRAGSDPASGFAATPQRARAVGSTSVHRS